MIFLMGSKKKLIAQINSSPEPLRSYIHEMESFIGNGAHMIQDLFLQKEKIKYLSMLLKKEQNNPVQPTRGKPGC